MDTKIPVEPCKNLNNAIAINSETGFYWVRLDDTWFIVQFESHKKLFYFPGYFDGIDAKQLHEINGKRLHKKFDGHKRKAPGIEGEIKSARPEGYYWVMHDAMWFATYYLPSKDEFYFPGQVLGFDPTQLEEIDEQKIEKRD